MMCRRTQFGVRENTASSRQHASHFAVPSAISEFSAKHYGGSPELQTLGRATLRAELEHPFHAALGGAATAGKESSADHLFTVREVADLLQVPASWVYQAKESWNYKPSDSLLDDCYFILSYWVEFSVRTVPVSETFKDGADSSLQGKLLFS
jgi:hypothetical protein